MPDKSALGKRMKENYEQRTKYKLVRRCPVIIRLDGKAFHTYTKGLVKPFDEGLIEDMMETTRFLCSEIMGVKCGYTQSDEISLLITDFDKLETEAWFDYNLQKMCSIAASLATAKFNQLRLKRITLGRKTKVMKNCDEVDYIAEDMISSTTIATTTLAYFDARVFQIPEKEEVVNYFIWRQRDAEKNSIAMLAQSLYSHNELYKKNGSDMQEMCFQKGHNWNDLHFSKKRGSFVIKQLFINDEKATTGDLNDGDTIWYQPESKDSMFPNKLGRALKWAETNLGDGHEDWCDIEIEKIRTKWISDYCPIFSQRRQSILRLM